jgi:hypothetical protein
MIVTLLACGVLILAGYHLIRLLAALLNWQNLTPYYLPGSLWYLAISALIWFAAWLPTGLGLWKGKPCASWSIQAFTPIYILLHWLERLYQLDSAGSLGANWLFSLVVSCLALILPYLVLNRASSKLFFRSSP